MLGRRHSKLLTIFPIRCGPVSSMHDRACELYYTIKGGTVDYGEEHAKQHGHVCLTLASSLEASVLMYLVLVSLWTILRHSTLPVLVARTSGSFCRTQPRRHNRNSDAIAYCGATLSGRTSRHDCLARDNRCAFQRYTIPVFARQKLSEQC